MKYPNVQVSKGMAGWFAVLIWWNPDGFPEPYETSDGRHSMQADAIAEASSWAAAIDVPFYPPKKPDARPARQDVENQILELLPNLKIHRLKDRP